MKNDEKRPQDVLTEIFEEVGKSLEDMDYSAVGDTIRESVEFIRKEAENGYESFRVKKSKEFERFSANLATPYERSRASVQRQKNGQYTRRIIGEGQRLSNQKSRGIFREIPGQIQGPVEMVFGIAALAMFGGATFTFGALAGVSLIAGAFHAAFAALFATSLPFTIGGGFLLGHGIRAKKRADRLSKYDRQFKDKMEAEGFIRVTDLAKSTEISEKQIIEDMHFIMDQKILPFKIMDEQETCIILTDEARQQYNEAEKSRLERELAEAQQKEEEERLQRKKAEATKEEREWYEFEEQIKTFLSELQTEKQKIDTPVMREHMDQIELLLSQIYMCIEAHPEMIGGTGHLVSYYLPCMLKLFKTYEDLEEQPIQGENIQKTKKEIENSFETIEKALASMYDELFRNVSMDISSDISVLKAMMAQDGLSENQIKLGGFKPNE